jgi:hypothetical protein
MALYALLLLNVNQLLLARIQITLAIALRLCRNLVVIVHRPNTSTLHNAVEIYFEISLTISYKCSFRDYDFYSESINIWKSMFSKLHVQDDRLSYLQQFDVRLHGQLLLERNILL